MGWVGVGRQVIRPARPSVCADAETGAEGRGPTRSRQGRYLGQRHRDALQTADAAAVVAVISRAPHPGEHPVARGDTPWVPPGCPATDSDQRGTLIVGTGAAGCPASGCRAAQTPSVSRTTAPRRHTRRPRGPKSVSARAPGPRGGGGGARASPSACEIRAGLRACEIRAGLRACEIRAGLRGP